MSRTLLSFIALWTGVVALQATNIPIPPFAPMTDWASASWRTTSVNRKDAVSYAGGALTITQQASDSLDITCRTPLASNLKPGTTIRFSVEAQGQGQPKTYEYGMVLIITYQDKTQEAWTEGKIFQRFPKDIPQFTRFRIMAQAKKPVSAVNVRFLFKGQTALSLRHPVLTITPPEQAPQVTGTQNLLTNARFNDLKGHELPGWNLSRALSTPPRSEDGSLLFRTMEKDYLELVSQDITPPSPLTAVEYGCDFKGETQTKSWRHLILVDATYEDGTRNKWTKVIDLPKKAETFTRLHSAFTPDKPVKFLNFKLLYEGKADFAIRNPYLRPLPPPKTRTDRKGQDGNLIQNPTFTWSENRRSIPSWSANAETLRTMRSAPQGGLRIALPPQQEFQLHSNTITLNQKTPVTLRYGITFKGDCYPISYFHGMVLDKVVYMDGTTEGWSATHFIFRAHAKNWGHEKTAWTPPKPIRSLRILLLFKGSAHADFQLRDIFLKQDPTAFNSKDSTSNFTAGPTNLVSNGNFEIIRHGDPKNWSVFFETHPTNHSLKENLTVNLDKTVRHGGNYSLRLSDSKDSLAGIENVVYSIIDPQREFTFSGWVKADKATGNTFLEVLFFRAWAPMGIGSAAGDNLNRVNNRADLTGVYRTPITAGTHDWKQLSVTMTPPPGANLVRFRIHSINNAGTVWIDDLLFDGFGNAPMELFCSQLGYPADGTKKAYVRCRTTATAGTFRLLDAKGQQVLQGNLKPRGTDPWNCHNLEADFTAVKNSGDYVLEVTVNGLKLTSHKLAITPIFYEKLTEYSRDFMFHMRCGYDIPGFHKACHLDDGQLRSKNNLLQGGKVIGHHDVSGGWHDAGDYDKFPGPTIQPIVTFARLSKRFNSPALLDEARWGAKWLCKIATPKGVYYQVLRLSPNGSIIIDICTPESETDNVIGNQDDRVAIGPGHDIMVPFALLEHALVETDPNIRKECLDKGLMLYHDFLKTDEKMKDDCFNQFNGPALIECDLALYRLTNQNTYLDHARHYLNALLTEVESSIRNHRWDSFKQVHFHPFAWAIVPLEYAIAFPLDPLSAKVRKVFQNYLEQNVWARLQKTPMRTFNADLWHLNGSSTGHGTITNLALSTLMARAAVVFKQPKYLSQAEENFHYITGINDLNASQITGLGHRTVTTWIASSAIPGHADGTVLKGAVLKGINTGPGNRNITAACMANGIYDYNIDHPKHYPAMMMAADYPMAGATGSQEVWESLNGNMMRAIDAIIHARDVLK